MRRLRKTKIIATLGPASSDPDSIEALHLAGADVFRLNFSHGDHKDHEERVAAIRKLEGDVGRPIGILADLQGPKIRIGTFKNGSTMLTNGAKFRLDLDETPGDEKRVSLPHPAVLESLDEGSILLLDDGKLKLMVVNVGKDFVDCEVAVGGKISDRKGVNIPNALVRMSPLTDKDRRDLDFALSLGVDWVALSFVQRPEDIAEVKKIVAGRAAVMAKIEKPAAVEALEGIIDLSDAIMVARGDLGVEMPIQEVPSIQKRIITQAREAGKPVVVATQMLESMIASPVPTRAEVTDVANAIYDGTDAVMLSAESAAGEFPLEAVTMMSDIAEVTERDPLYRSVIDAKHGHLEATTADAISAAASQVAHTIGAAAIVTYTTSGSTALRAARERGETSVLVLTPSLKTARMLALVWGLHCVHTSDAENFADMVNKACRKSFAEGFTRPGDRVVIMAGVPFGTPGSTNILRIAWVGEQ
ncbi:pyruvate kinase [Sneathiella chungangensis]|uniref:Pyruvate kinase n=1 Tax=Sneathiella chungangensis TaxID=1418234 RepID=A0A845MEW2_9PROT|nr:pyruvate kinase [Sneathiella chungangensis]MZR22215.1 pyruvate kinase [Sneathiella chungangensis]